MSRLLILCAFVILAISKIYAQSYLRVTSTKFGRTRVYDLYINGPIEYKLKGKMWYKTNMIMAMSDSTLVLDNHKEVNFKDIKSIKMHLDSHLISSFQYVFMFAGIAFIPLNTLNNLIIDGTPGLDERVVLISAGLIATGYLIKQLGIRRVHLNKNTDFKVLTLDFQKLNSNGN